MVNPISNIGSMLPKIGVESLGTGKTVGIESKVDFEDTIKAAGKQISKVSDIVDASNTSIKDLLAGKETDITAVVAAAAKAEMSFKLLVGVRNKLIEAYKQTMNMQL